MEAEETQRSRWRSLAVFAGCCGVNVVLTFAAVPLAFASMGAPPGKVSVSAFDVWMWIFVFPAAAVKELDGTWTRANVLTIINPLIYGSMWWLAWRMWTLFRRKPPE